MTTSPIPPRTDASPSRRALLVRLTARPELPVVAMLLTLALVAALVWLLAAREQADKRSMLIEDALWLEQNLRFQITSSQEKVSQLALDLAQDGDAARLRAKATHILSTHPEMERLLWLDKSAQVLLAVPPFESLGAVATTPAAGPDRPQAFALARAQGKPVYTGAYRVRDRGAAFEAHVPIFRDGEFIGTLVAVQSVNGLLAHHVPWWIAQRDRVSLVDGVGNPLGAKSSLPADPSGLSHAVELDPPGHGMTLIASSESGGPSLLQLLLTTAIAALSLLTVASLWALRRSLRRRAEAERALVAEHMFRKAMEDSLIVGLRARDLKGRTTYVNAAFCRMVGFSDEELVNCDPPYPYWAPEEWERSYALFSAVLAGEAPRDGFELRFRRKDGTRLDVLIHEAPLIDMAGQHAGWMSSVLDVTARKRAERLARDHQDTLERTTRLVAMGEMASTLAHELNQPLSAIASYAAGCLNRLQAPPGPDDKLNAELTGALTKLGSQAQRAGQIIRRVYDFARKRPPVLVPCSVEALLAEAGDLLQPDATTHGVRIERPASGPLPDVPADRLLLMQVLLNLGRNAIEALADMPAERRVLRLSARAEAGEVIVAVADTGPGMAAERATALFTPFVSSKPEGMGMGLNICRSIIEHHRGRLWYDRLPDGGSLFQFALPAASADTALPAPPDLHTAMP
jgi:two-component system, LuxR family, sensor histidine kinase DctS